MDTKESFEADSNVFTLVQQAELDNMTKAEAVNRVHEKRIEERKRLHQFFSQKCRLKGSYKRNE